MGRTLVLALCLAALVAMLAQSDPAQASVKGRKTTAALLTGAAIYHLAKGHGPEALVFTGGAIYAWDRVRQAKRHRVGSYHHRAMYAKRHRRHYVTRHRRR